MNGLSIYDMIGLLGVASYLGSYAALQLGFLRGQGYAYAGWNAISAGLVLLSLEQAFNLSAAVTQIAWIVISLVGIIRYYLLTSRSRFTPEEREFLEATMPGLGPADARRLLDLGVWATGEPGTRLTEAGAQSASLYYLLNGSAYVFIEGKVIARLENHAFIGEMGMVQRAPASATVELGERSRYLSLPVAAVQRLTERNVNIRHHLNSAMWAHVMGKLVQTNRDLADLSPGL
ncbi:MAG: cyclic nucleotide-binding domain-containing protein [Arenicellales bacterium]